ncbi:hypothetical protein [Akkermansia muciniphila]|uniref:hypothetical protein n=1 Tax=Akkermansia muciniphila TaxID=239935 RepID=UPI0016518233|nr:hypothetical protein [Akkermansia muciniphila]
MSDPLNKAYHDFVMRGGETLNNRFDKIDAKLDSIKAAMYMKTTIGNKLDTVNSTINKANTDIVAAINAMKASNDTKNDAIITAPRLLHPLLIPFLQTA